MKFKILVNLFLILAASNFGISAPHEPIYLEEFLQGTFSNIGFNGVWITDNTFLYKNSTSGDVYEFDAETWTAEVFFPSTVLADYASASYTLSADGRYVLIRYNPQAIFRHSTIAQFAIYDLESSEYHDVGDKEHLQYAAWSPVGHKLIYIFENNIYYLENPSSTVVQISTDGVADVIYNGVPDWVYEEEVLSSGSATWFSPDGNRIAFAHFNDTDVPEFDYFIYGDAGEKQYPDLIKLRYPKVNAINPDFELRVVSLDNPTSVQSLPILLDGQESRDNVLFGVTWATNDEVVAVVENRIQNEALVRRCQVDDLSCETENRFVEEKGWIELSPPVYSADGTRCLLLISQPVGDDFYKQLVLYDVASKSITRLTEGERVVTAISGWDETMNVIYYAGSYVGVSSQQHVFYVNLTNLENVCITCTYILPDESFCLYASATFSKAHSYFAETCTGPGPNSISINTIKNLGGGKLYEDNALLRAQLSDKLLPEKLDFNVPVEGGFTAKARLLVPPNLDTSGNTKYPVIVYVYAGPNSNYVTDRYAMGYPQYAVTNRQFIYAYIDGRGSGRNGNNLMFEIYRRMGTVEIEDQISVMKSLANLLPYIDRDRIAIWGWSYGGFSTAWVLVQDVENVFKCGLSVAPVTDFTLYDTIYTERYMGLATPEDNAEGYNNTDLSRRVEGLRNKQFYLVHGNADDNVHYQQSMLLAKALEHADIMFYQMSYPDENHGLGGVYPHLYHTVDRFWSRCFGLPELTYTHPLLNVL